MISFTTAVLVGVALGLLIAALLIMFGIYAIHSGRRSLSRARSSGQDVSWHQQPSLLFGLNNIVFALLVVCVTLLGILLDHTTKYLLIAAIVLLLVVSVILVIRCIGAAMQTTRDVSQRKN